MSQDNLSIAKSKVKKLTHQVEESLYELRYRDSKYNILNETLYSKLKAVCDDATCNKKKLTFPLIRHNGKICLNSNNDDLYTVLHILAVEFNIILDYTEII